MKQGKKILTLSLCAALALGCLGGAGYTLATGSDSPAPAGSAAPAPGSAPSVQGDGTEPVRDETVYVLAGADGSVQKVIVSDWLKNPNGSETLRDTANLTDVENVKGDEGYTLSGDNARIWDAQGNDIYCQGSTTQELPVGMTIRYQLDGKPITPEALAGKSGRVTIRFTYENRQFEMADIHGRQEKIYVPFTMLTGLLLDDAVFTNVEVSNGKVLNDGGRTVVIGIAFPGLQESLGLDAETLEFPDYVEITADTTGFALGTTVTLATSELFDQLDTGKLDSLDELSGSLDELTSAMDQLMDGSSQLYDGLCTLLDHSGELIDGIDALAAGAGTLKDGTGDLSAGAAQLQAGAVQLSTGLNTLTAHSSALNQGARQVFDTLLSTADTQIAAAGLSVPALTVENYASVLNEVIASLDGNAVYEKALAQVTAMAEEQRGAITEQVAAVVREGVEAQVTAAVREQMTAQMTQAGMDAAAAEGAVDGQLGTEEVQGMIAAQVEEQMQSGAVQAMIAENTEQQVQKAVSEAMAGETVQAQLAAASEGAQSLIALKSSLDSYNAFYLGLQSYTAGVAEAAAGAGSLQEGAAALGDGASRLDAGADALYQGILTLQDSAPALTEGVTRLRDGAMQLSGGLKEFNEQGIQKLVDAVGGDLSELSARLQAAAGAGKRYRSFSESGSGMDSQVKFVFRTEEVKEH